MVFDLVRDFADALAALPAAHPRRGLLALLDEAVRRDVQFVARHPTALFQCLWNSGWWFDNPATPAHYPPTAARPAAEPWDNPAGLMRCLDRLRAVKDRTTPGHVWVRALRPPSHPLGTGLVARLPGYGGTVWGAAWSADDARLVAGGGKEVRVWDTATGRLLLAFPAFVSRMERVTVSYTNEFGFRVREEVDREANEIKAVYGVALSPDGRRIAAGVDRPLVWEWDAADGRPLRELAAGKKFVKTVRYSRDGRRLVAAGSGGTIHLFDVESGAEVRRIAGPDEVLSCVRFSPDERRLLAVDQKANVRLWAADTGELAGEWQGFATAGGGSTFTSLNDACFSADGSRIAAVGYENPGGLDGEGRHLLVVFDPAGRRLLEMDLTDRIETLTAVEFLPDDRLLVGGQNDSGGLLAAVDPTGRRPAQWFATGLGAINGLALSHDGTRVAATGATAAGGEAAIWRLDGEPAAPAPPDHMAGVAAVRFTPDGARFLTTGRGHAAVWTTADARPGPAVKPAEVVRTGARRFLNLIGSPGQVRATGLSADGRRFLVWSDEFVQVWDADSGRKLFDLPEQEYVLETAELYPDGNRVLVAVITGLTVWDVATGEPDLSVTGCGNVAEARLSADGGLILCDTAENFWVFDATTGRTLYHLPHPYDSEIRGIELSANRATLVRWGRQLTCYGTRGPERRFTAGGYVRDAVLSADGGRLAVHDREDVVVHDARTGAELARYAGECDLAAAAAGPDQCPWLAVTAGGETAWVEAATGRPAAWYPVELAHLRPHPADAVWAGALGGRVCLLRVEGVRVPPRPAPPPPIDLPAPLLPAAPARGEPAGDDAILAQVDALLQAGRPAEALALIGGRPARSDALANAAGVCLLRLGEVDRAADAFRALARSGPRFKAGAPTVYRANLATAVLLQPNVGGCLALLDEIGDEGHPSVRRLREAIRSWQSGRRLRDRLLGLFGAGPRVVLGFPPGDLQ